MRRLTFTLVALTATFLMTTGCFPVRFTRSPGVSGVLLDGQTQAPLVGAQASMRHPGGGKGSDPRRAFVTSDQKGRFSVPALREWATWNPFWFPLNDMKECRATLCIRHEGYEPTEFQFTTEKKSLKLAGPLFLKPVPNKAGGI